MAITLKCTKSNEWLIFQATDELAEAIRSRAAAAGLTVAEYLCGVIAGSVGVHEIVSPLCARLAEEAFVDASDCAHGSAVSRSIGSPCTDPIALLSAAGSGDTQAQRDLSGMAIALALSGRSDIDPFVTLSEGLIFARLADRHDEADDALRILRMLALASTLAAGSAARHLAAEAIARLELVAGGQSEYADVAADLLASSMASEHPETVKLAKDYRDRLRDVRPDRWTADDAS